MKVTGAIPRPVMAFGNSDGDYEMLRYSTAGAGPRFGLIVHHTAADREHAYDRKSPFGCLDWVLDEAPKRGWVVVDMKGGPHVRVFSGKDGSMLANFFAFEVGHRSGVTVAAGDVNGDGTIDIVTGSGPGDGSEIRVFDGTLLGQPGAMFASFFAYGTGYLDGVFIAAGNLDGDPYADIIAGPLSRGSTTQTVVYTGNTLEQHVTFFEDEPSLFVGIRFTIADANGDGIDDMVVVAAEGGGPRRIVVNPLTGKQLENTFFDDEFVRSSYDVGG